MENLKMDFILLHKWKVTYLTTSSRYLKRRICVDKADHSWGEILKVKSVLVENSTEKRLNALRPNLRANWIFLRSKGAIKVTLLAKPHTGSEEVERGQEVGDLLSRRYLSNWLTVYPFSEADISMSHQKQNYESFL